MKVLVATHITQGDDVDDYCWTVDGELVTPVSPVCSNPECGCERGFAGLGSSRATTTAMVVDLDHIGEHELENVVLDSLRRGAWLEGLSAVAQYATIQEHVDAIIRVAQSHRLGTIVCRSGDVVYARESLAA